VVLGFVFATEVLRNTRFHPSKIPKAGTRGLLRKECFISDRSIIFLFPEIEPVKADSANYGVLYVRSKAILQTIGSNIPPLSPTLQLLNWHKTTPVKVMVIRTIVEALGRIDTHHY
jgi:hypothetical protein